MRDFRVLCWLAILLAGVFTVRPASAQDDPNFETGVKPYGSYNGGNIDTVNLMNGNLTADIPIISYPQRGGKLKLDFVLHYIDDGYYYDMAYIYDPYGNVIGSTSSGGTGSEFGTSGWYIEQKGVPVQYTSAWTDYTLSWLASAALTMSDGAVHQLNPTSLTGLWRDADGSGFTSPGYNTSTSLTAVTDSSGVTYGGFDLQGVWSLYSGGAFPIGAASAEDTNGNKISLTSSGTSVTGWEDSMGRNIPVPALQSGVTGCPTSPNTPTSSWLWNLPGINGGTYPILFCYIQVPFTYHTWTDPYNTGGYDTTWSGTSPMLQTMVLPNGTAWSLQYTTDGNQDMSQVTFPTGGTISYTFGTGPVNGTATHTFTSTQIVTSRTLNPNDGVSSAATWTYGYTPTTSVTDPAGNVTVHQFSVPTGTWVPYETETDYYQSSSTLLKTLDTVYTSTGCGNSGALPTQVTTVWPSGQQSKIQYGYDSASTSGTIGAPNTAPTPTFYGPMSCSFGKEITKSEYDYGSGAPGSLLRTTNTTYQFQSNSNYLTNNLLNLPASVQVQDGGGTQRAYTTYTYDGSTPTASGVTTQLDVPPPTGATYRGNQTSSGSWVNTTGGYLTSSKVFFDTGEVETAYDPKSNPTGYGYSSSSCPTGTGYAGSGPTSVTNALSQTTYYCYDLDTGVMTSVKDPNSQTTSYTYDSTMNRPATITYPDGGSTTFCYTDTGPTAGVLTCSQSSSPLYAVVITEAIKSGMNKTSTAILDGFGRPFQTKLNSDPSGPTYTETQYDGLGRKYMIYNPTRCSAITSNCGESTWGYTTYSYDGIGRPTTVTKQDGSTVQTSYSGNSTTVTDEASHPRLSITDGAGRLVEVDEPGGSGVATSGSGSGTVSGTEQSSGGSSPTSGTGTVTISGTEQHIALFYDQGTVSITVNGHTDTINYSHTLGNDNPTSIAISLVNAINGDSSSYVTASHSSGVITLTAKTTGTSTNYTFSANITYWTAHFSHASFTATPSGSTLTGGTNGSGATYDSGSIWITVNGVQSTASYGSSSTTTSVASALVSAINSNPSSPVTASASGSVVTVTASGTGSSTNYSLSAGSSTSFPGTFSSPSFTVSGSTLTGGQDAGVYSLSTPFVTTYSYDALDDLVSVTQGGSHSRSFVYDSLKRLLQSTNPETGSVCYGTLSGSTCQNNGYDGDGNVIYKSDARSYTITYSYDAVNRMTGRSYSNGDPSVSYSYDGSTCIGTSPCFNVGRRTSMSDAGGSETVSYDQMGREWGEQRTTNGYTKTTGYAYNLDGSIASLTYPSGRTITYTPSGAGRPVQAVDSANGINYATNATYAPPGELAEIQFDSGNLTSTLIYNDRLQPCWLYATATSSALASTTACTATATAGNILDLKYNFNLGSGDNGNVMGIANNRDSTRSQAFTYDTLNRILTGNASTYATSPANCWGEQYTYDQWTNLYALGPISSSYSGCYQDNLTGISATSSNQLSATGLTYDTSGNVLTDGVNTYAWNAESEMKTGTGVNYTYDGDGNRLQKSSGKLYWYGAGTEILDESDASGNITNEYVFFGGKRIALRNISSGNIYYYAEDFLGSSRTMVQAGATSPCFDADFLPFGYEKDVSTTCTQNSYKFEGKERDTETGNDDFGARYYSSNFGRWESPDWSSIPAPVPYANLTNPQTLNLYAMVGDNPETFADLDGHDPAADQPGCTSQMDGACGPMNPSKEKNDEARQSTSTAAEQQKAAQNPQVAPTGTGYTTYHGKSAAYASTITGFSGTSDSKGRVISTTMTVTTAFFSTESGHEGQFLGAGQTVTTNTGGPGAMESSSRTTDLTYGQARQIIGGAGMDSAIRGTMPDAISMFPGTVAKDVRAHPGRYMALGAEAALIATPVPEAYEGAKAVADVGLAAAHLAWDLIH